LPIAEGDRLHLKANRRLASGRRVTNGEIVTAKAVHANGEIELSDSRVLDKSFREFLPGYAVTSYCSQGRTVDYVLFSDSTVKAATNAQQWYVTFRPQPNQCLRCSGRAARDGLYAGAFPRAWRLGNSRTHPRRVRPLPGTARGPAQLDIAPATAQRLDEPEYPGA